MATSPNQDKPNLRSAAGLSLLQKILQGETPLNEDEKEVARKMAEKAVQGKAQANPQDAPEK